MTSEDCRHESWECTYGWHRCTDCRVTLGSRQTMYEDHNADICEVCGPHVVHESDGVTACILPHPCPNKTYAHKVSRRKEQVSQQQEEMDVPLGSFKFDTKDSGKREEYDSGMRRDTQEGKPRFDLLLASDLPYEGQFLTRIARLLERGAVKYGERNWELAEGPEEYARFRASANRHMMQYLCNELDEDHMAAVAFNLMAAEYVKWKLDNRA